MGPMIDDDVSIAQLERHQGFKALLDRAWIEAKDDLKNIDPKADPVQVGGYALYCAGRRDMLERFPALVQEAYINTKEMEDER